MYRSFLWRFYRHPVFNQAIPTLSESPGRLANVPALFDQFMELLPDIPPKKGFSLQDFVAATTHAGVFPIGRVITYDAELHRLAIPVDFNIPTFTYSNRSIKVDLSAINFNGLELADIEGNVTATGVTIEVSGAGVIVFDLSGGNITTHFDASDITAKYEFDVIDPLLSAQLGLVRINAGGPHSYVRIQCQVGGSLIAAPVQAVLQTFSSLFQPTINGVVDIHLANVWLDPVWAHKYGNDVGD